MASSTWRNLPAAKRERVLLAAMREFGRRGFSAGSLNTVAREAGIAKGSLFQYFDDKLDLYTTVCARVGEEARAATMAGLDLADSRPFFDVVRHLLANWLGYFRDNPMIRDIGLAIKQEMDPAAREAVWSTVNTYYVETLAPLAKRAADRGELRRDTDPNQLIAMLILILRFLDAAPFYPYMDPILGLYEKTAAEVDAAAVDLVAALERAFANPNGGS